MLKKKFSNSHGLGLRILGNSFSHLQFALYRANCYIWHNIILFKGKIEPKNLEK